MEIKDKVIEILKTKIEDLDINNNEINNQISLLEQGILDSMSFLEFTVELETEFDIEFDFSEIEPSQFTSIDGILKIINNAKQK